MLREALDFNDIHKEQGSEAVREQVNAAQLVPDDEWPEPDMKLIEGYRQPAPSFPVRLFGDFWRCWLNSAAESKSAPVDYTAGGLLSCASVMIGNACLVSPWDGWTEPPVFWGCCIGLPSSGKTPGISAALDPLRDLELEINPGFDEEMREYERKLETSKAARKTWEQEVKTALKEKAPAPNLPELAAEPERPCKKRLLIMDATVEIIAPILTKNPKGILLFRDELAGWLNGLNQYKGGNGSDRAFYLEAWNGKSFTVDRVKWGMEGSVTVPHLSIPILGGMQPERFVQAVLSDADDGMSARFVYFYPDPVPPQRPRTTPDNGRALEALKKLHGLTLRSDGDDREYPSIIMLEPSAANMLTEFRQDVYEEEKTASGHYLSYLGKNPGKAIRLSLIIEFLQWAATDDPLPPETISKRSLLSALHLITGYFNPMARRAFDDAALPEETRNAVTLAKWIARKRLAVVNTREIQRGRLSGLDTAEKLEKAIDELIEAGWLKSSPENHNTGGRPRRDYLANPKIRGRT